MMHSSFVDHLKALHAPILACAVAVCLVWAGCGDSGSSEPSTSGEACEALGATTCDRALTCNLTFTDRDLCTRQFVSQCCERDGTCADSLSADEEALFAQCTEDVANAECEGFGNPPPASCESLGVRL